MKVVFDICACCGEFTPESELEVVGDMFFCSDCRKEETLEETLEETFEEAQCNTCGEWKGSDQFTSEYRETPYGEFVCDACVAWELGDNSYVQ